MRTTLEIIIANQENQPCTEQELRLALEALRNIRHFEHEELKKLIEVVRNEKPTAKMRADFAWGTIERMFAAIKKPPDEWLGPDNIPGSPAQVKRLEWAKGVARKAGVPID